MSSGVEVLRAGPLGCLNTLRPGLARCGPESADGLAAGWFPQSPPVVPAAARWRGCVLFVSVLFPFPALH
ncbi:MAG: hypothetical protein ACKOGA_00480 [Planctomycetaceae bacterium]